MLLKFLLALYASTYYSYSVGSITGHVVSIWFRMKSINEILQLNLQSRNQIKVVSSTKIEDETVLTVLMKSYSTLLDICDEVNLCYGFQTMLGFGVVFFYTIFSVFTAYTDFITQEKLSTTSIAPIAYFMYYIVFMTLVISTCMKLQNEVKLWVMKIFQNFNQKICRHKK